MVSALGLDGMSAGVCVSGNIVDRCLGLGLVAAAGGRDAAALAYRLLMFGPQGAGLAGGSGGEGGGFLASAGESMLLYGEEEGGGLEGGEGGAAAAAAAAAAAGSLLPRQGASSSSSFFSGGGAGREGATAEEAALASAAHQRIAHAQLRHSQAILQTLSIAGGAAAGAVTGTVLPAATAAAGSGGAGATTLSTTATTTSEALLATLAREEHRAATASGRRKPSRPHAPYAAGYEGRLGQAPLPPSNEAFHTLPPTLACRLYPLVSRLASPHATAHLYRPGCEPPRYHGASPPLRQWVPLLHGDTPEGFARFSSGGEVALGDVPVKHATCRWVVLRNVRGALQLHQQQQGPWEGQGAAPPPQPGFSASSGAPSPSPSPSPSAQLVHFSWDCAHALVAGGCLRITPSAGTLRPGEAALCRFDFIAPPTPIILASDIACCVSAPPQELFATGVESTAWAWEAKGAAAAGAAREGGGTPHALTAERTTASARAKVVGRAREFAVRAHIKASAGEALKGKSVYASLAEGAAMGAVPVLGATAGARTAALNSTRGAATPSSRTFDPPTHTRLPPGVLSMVKARANPLIPPPLSHALAPRGSARTALVSMGVLPGEGGEGGEGEGEEGGEDARSTGGEAPGVDDDEVGSETATVGAAGPRLRAEGAAERAAREARLLLRSREGGGEGEAATAGYFEALELGGGLGAASSLLPLSHSRGVHAHPEAPLGQSFGSFHQQQQQQQQQHPPHHGLTMVSSSATSGVQPPSLNAEAALASAMIRAVVHAGGPSVAALSLTGALPPTGHGTGIMRPVLQRAFACPSSPAMRPATGGIGLQSALACAPISPGCMPGRAAMWATARPWGGAGGGRGRRRRRSTFNSSSSSSSSLPPLQLGCCWGMPPPHPPQWPSCPPPRTPSSGCTFLPAWPPCQSLQTPTARHTWQPLCPRLPSPNHPLPLLVRLLLLVLVLPWGTPPLRVRQRSTWRRWWGGASPSPPPASFPMFWAPCWRKLRGTPSWHWLRRGGVG